MKKVFAYVLLVTCVCFSTGNAATLEALWEFNGDFTSAVNHSYDGVPNGTVTFVDGVSDKAAHFDGTKGPQDSSSIDYVDSLAKPANAEFNGGFSIMAWIKPEGGWGHILGHSSTYRTVEYGFTFRWRSSLESPYDNALRLSMNDSRLVGGMMGTSIPGTVPPGVWSHVAVTWDGDPAGGIHLYVNGQPVTSNIELNPAGFLGLDTLGPMSIRIGCTHADSSGNIFSFDGSIDHISLWKGAVTASEVMADFMTTSNKPPIADAGTDQSIIKIGSTVQLDGSQSYDIEGDPIRFEWSFVSKPEDSNAEISDPTSPMPTFRADVQGAYTIMLVISDGYSSSLSDEVVISFENVIPVANAGLNQSVIQGDEACFDGSGSSDANFDPISYLWALTSKPLGSSAFLSDVTSESPCLVTDLPGYYEATLIVNDGFADSDPEPATVYAAEYQDAVSLTLQEAITVINSVDIEYFKNKNMQNTLTNKLNATLELVAQGDYIEAREKLQNDILGKIDGCMADSTPDKNDWIQDCTSQGQVYPIVMKAIGYLDNL